MIFAECLKNKEFDPNVDISSIFPVFFEPIVIKSLEGQREIIGVLEIVLKNSKNAEISENLEAFSERFAKIVETGYKIAKDYFI